MSPLRNTEDASHPGPVTSGQQTQTDGCLTLKLRLNGTLSSWGARSCVTHHVQISWQPECHSCKAPLVAVVAMSNHFAAAMASASKDSHSYTLTSCLHLPVACTVKQRVSRYFLYEAGNPPTSYALSPADGQRWKSPDQILGSLMAIMAALASCQKPLPFKVSLRD